MEIGEFTSAVLEDYIVYLVSTVLTAVSGCNGKMLGIFSDLVVSC